MQAKIQLLILSLANIAKRNDMLTATQNDMQGRQSNGFKRLVGLIFNTCFNRLAIFHFSTSKHEMNKDIIVISIISSQV